MSARERTVSSYVALTYFQSRERLFPSVTQWIVPWIHVSDMKGSTFLELRLRAFLFRFHFSDSLSCELVSDERAGTVAQQPFWLQHCCWTAVIFTKCQAPERPCFVSWVGIDRFCFLCDCFLYSWPFWAVFFCTQFPFFVQFEPFCLNIKILECAPTINTCIWCDILVLLCLSNRDSAVLWLICT